eukprot:gene48835-66295_t
MLPVNFLRQLISMYGDSMQAMVPGYLDASMDSFRRNQEQFKSAVEGAFANSPFANTPFAELAKRNMAMFEAAAQAFKPGAKPGETTATAASKDDEIAALKAELGRLNDKIEKLGNVSARVGPSHRPSLTVRPGGPIGQDSAASPGTRPMIAPSTLQIVSPARQP